MIPIKQALDDPENDMYLEIQERIALKLFTLNSRNAYWTKLDKNSKEFYRNNADQVISIFKEYL